MKFITKEDQGITFVNLMEGDEVLLSVAPMYGAKLVQLKLKNDQGFHDLLWQMSAEDLKTNDWYKSALLFPYPNRLEGGKYHFDGTDYKFPINEPDKGNQLHGMVFDRPFEVTHQEVKNQAKLSLTYKYDGSESPFPFPFSFTISYIYAPDSFTVQFDVKNTGSEPFPYGIGWHPYFRIDQNSIHQYKLELPALNIIELNKNAIPTGEEESYPDQVIDLQKTRLDNGFRITDGNRNYALVDSKSGVRVEMKASDGFDYIQIFTPPGDETVAVEPMTCNVNAFNNGQGLRVLNAGQTFQGSFQITIG